MKRVSMVLGVFALAVLVAGPALADDGFCSEESAVKISDDCGSYTWAGCCQSDGILWCEQDGSALCWMACDDAEYPCGWIGIYSDPEWGDIEINAYLCGGDGEDPSGENPIECNYSCTPDCTDRECGTDGCYGSCGSCGDPTKPACNADGQCVDCAPACWGKLCGDDGCGGTCGGCESGDVCVEDDNGWTSCCTPQCDGLQCGYDGCGGSCGSCGEDENCMDDGQCEVCTCEGKVCGDDGCGEPCGSCPAGTGCSDGQCVDAPDGCGVTQTPGCGGCAVEECVCEQDDVCCTTGWDSLCSFIARYICGLDCPCMSYCENMVCGDDGCGGTCGSCDDGEYCTNFGRCAECTCEGKECGGDGCGVDCGTCPDGETCLTGTCVPAGCAESAEAGCGGCECEECVCDRDSHCCDTEWDGTCAEMCSEDCGFDCPCVPYCEANECGSDGCGGSCGTCLEGMVCDGNNLCCEPVCEGKVCGDDGCDGVCGTCEVGLKCEDGACVDCTPDCTGKECGDNGCGGSCGECGTGLTCSANQCIGYPDDCVDFQTGPSLTYCPDGASDAGCCDADGRVVWCEDEQMFCIDCAGNDMQCGWRDSEGYYDCGYLASEDETEEVLLNEDPSGTNPRDCDFCVPVCDGKVCGDNGCGGVCGTCGIGSVCQDGLCVAVIEDDVYEGDTGMVEEDHGVVLTDPGLNEDTSIVSDISVSTDTTVPTSTDSDDGCSAGAGANSTGLGFIVLVFGFALALVRRRLV